MTREAFDSLFPVYEEFDEFDEEEEDWDSAERAQYLQDDLESVRAQYEGGDELLDLLGVLAIGDHYPNLVMFRVNSPRQNASHLRVFS